MGEVYKAEDTRLGRLVALKFLPRRLSKNRQAVERFQREARAASALNHPHIYTIYDLGEHEEQPFIVMELLEGQTLKRRLTHPLDFDHVVELAIQIADALQAAHAKGIIHRDIKPANIFISERGQAKILDFGIAKLAAQQNERSEETDSSGEPGTGAQEDLTKAGVAVGTLGYMSPEQRLGKELDARTDIFSFGVVLYEMCTGQRVLLDDIAGQTPPSPRVASRKLPEELERIIRKAVEKDPGMRYQTMADLHTDLARLRRDTDARRLGGVLARERFPAVRPRSRLSLSLVGGGIATLLLLALLLYVGGWWEKWLGGAGSGRIESLAVLPLQNLQGDPKEDYFADGMTEALITDLSKIGSLKVISRTSVMRYKEADLPLRQIGRELGVDAVVEGSVLRAGDRVRITAQLVEVATDQHLWAESYERDLHDVLSLQREVARAIATEIKITLTPEESTQLAAGPAVSPSAYEDYLRGKYHWNKFTGEDFLKAMEYFKKASRSDPTYAAAYAGLADCYLELGWFGYLVPQQAFPQAKTALTKALELDETLGAAHTSLANIQFAYDWDWPGAEKSFQRALELNPGNALAHQWYADYLMFARGRPDEALVEIQRAQELDPLSLPTSTTVGFHLYVAGRYQEATEQLQKTLELAPDFPLAHHDLALVYLQQSKFEEAIAEFRKAAQASPESPIHTAALGYAYGVAGRKSDALEIARELENAAKRTYVSPYYLAWVYAGLGQSDQSLRWLEKGYDEKASLMVLLRSDPFFREFRSDPRFQALLRRMDFPQ